MSRSTPSATRIVCILSRDGEESSWSNLADLLRANRDDAGLVAEVRDAWRRRRAFKGRRVASLRLGGGATPEAFLTLHRHDLPSGKFGESRGWRLMGARVR